MSRYIVILTIILVAGCARTINRTAERKIRDSLPGYVGPARAWRAHVDSAPERTIQGQLSRVTIDGEGVALKNQLKLDRLHIEMDGVEVDTSRQELKSVRSTTFHAEITGVDLNDYLDRLPSSPEDAVRIQRAHLLNGHVRVEATRWLLKRAWPFTAIVEPRLESPTRLAFDPDRMTVEGIRVPLPAAVLRWLADRLGASFDLSTLPFPLRITSFRVAAGRAQIDGMADVLSSLKSQMARQTW